MAEANYVPDPRGEQALFTVLPGGDLGGGGSGGGAIQVYTGASPPAAPNNPALAAVFYPSGGGSMSNWDIPTQSWI